MTADRPSRVGRQIPADQTSGKQDPGRQDPGRQDPGKQGSGRQAPGEIPGGQVPGGPPAGGQLPGGLGLGQPFAELDSDVPLLLLPVRIETRYRLAGDPPQLLVRVYPDQVHIEHPSPVDPASPAGVPVAHAALLPRQWVITGYDEGGERLFRVGTSPVADPLATGASATEPTWDIDGSGVVVDPALAWMVEFERAVAAGMAVAIDLTGDAAAALTGVDTLVVVGVDATSDAAAAAARLSAVLDAHAATDGLAFVAQGTPTNNTTAGASGLAEEPALAARRARRVDQLGAGRATRVETGSGPGTTPPDAPGGLPLPLATGNAMRFARLLGLGSGQSWSDLDGGRDQEFEDARAMRVVLFEAVFGTLVRDLFDLGGQPGLGDEVIAQFRSWFLDRVVGGAPVPAVRIGSQPYGVLPVRAPGPPASPAAAQVERIVELLRPDWEAASAVVPSIDHGATDSSIDLPTETAICTILATQPHPARITWRTVDEYAASGPGHLLTAQFLYELVLLSLSATTNPALAPPFTHVAAQYASLNGDGRNDEIEDQVALWSEMDAGFAAWLAAEGASDPDGAAADFIGTARSIVTNYERRQYLLPELEMDRRGVALAKRVIGDDGRPTAASPVNTALVSAQFADSTREWGDVGVVQVPDAQVPAVYLDELRQRFAARHQEAQPSTLDDDFLAHPPLLYQLISSTMFQVPVDAAAESEFEAALDRLAGLDAARLEWLCREVLGLGTHRLDAWHTSLAADRLGAIRAEHPSGINVGAYGLVSTLVPAGAATASQGFVHAPSMGQAATAAILRSGYQAHGTDDPESAFAVDVSSRRVRDAQWLLAGVTRGQPLGELLGCRFERLLHDAALDHLIRPTRRAVLAAQDRPSAPIDEPVDGIDLLDLTRDGRVTLDPAADAVLGALGDAFDAATDLAVAEGVHQLASGSYARAAAMLDAVADGTSRAPDAEVVRTATSGPAVEHRVVVLLPAASTPGAGQSDARGWSTGLRDQVAPQVEQWVRTIVPQPWEIGFGVLDAVGVDGADAVDGVHVVVADLAALQLSALDAVHLAGDDPARVGAPLTVLIEAAIGPGTIDPTARGDRLVSLAEFGVLAAELSRLIDAARPGDGRDLRPAADPGEPPATDDAWDGVLGVLAARLGAAADQLSAALDAGQPAPVTGLTELARFGLGRPGPLGDAGRAGELLAMVRDRQRKLVGQVVPGGGPAVPVPGAPGPPIQLPTLVPPPPDERVLLLLGHRLPLLAAFEISAGGAIPDPALATADRLDEWLDAVGRVRPKLGRLTHAGLLSTALGAGGLSLIAAQYPAAPGGTWAAVARPAANGNMLCVTAVTGAAPVDVTAPVCAMVVDQWVEHVPNADQVTGVAVHFDAPTNQAPQVCVLQVLPDGARWSLEVVEDAVRSTLDWARLRAVAPEDLAVDGRTVPSVYVPGSITPLATTPAAGSRAAARGNGSAAGRGAQP